MPRVVPSVSGTPIRLTAERWAHILENHNELSELMTEVLETVARPEKIVEGKDGELLAVRTQELGKWLVVVYRESSEDGFIITAFLTSKTAPLERRQLWP